MNLQNKTNQKGFTIVELLIVIVVIGILAAITIVAYNGIQNRANTTAAQSTASSVLKKIEAYNSVKAVYPTTIANLNSEQESAVAGSGSNVVSTSTGVNATNGKNTVYVEKCVQGTSTVGGRVGYRDYSSGNLVYLTAGTVATPTGSTDTVTCSAMAA